VRPVKAKAASESLNALLKRLDKAVARFHEIGKTTGEINPPSD
jgi:hypothetical protein